MDSGAITLEVSADKRRLDVAAIHAFLAGSYWAKGRSRELVERSIANSVCFGGYLGQKQVAFGRIITDQVMFAFLADMFVLNAHRGCGYGSTLLRQMLAFIDGAGVPYTTLNTRDAAGFYARYGFTSSDSSSRSMRRAHPGGSNAT